MLARVNQNKLTMFSFVVLYKFCVVFISVTTSWYVLIDVSNSTQLCFGYFPWDSLATVDCCMIIIMVLTIL